MAVQQKIKFENFRSSGNAQQDIQTLAGMLANAMQHVYDNLPAKGVTGIFVSADTPAKTVTITNGIVTKIE